MSNGTETRGHLAASGGLRGHSIGDLYPFSVIGWGDGTWQAVNYETGEYFGKRYVDYEDAEAVAKRVKAGGPAVEMVRCVDDSDTIHVYSGHLYEVIRRDGEFVYVRSCATGSVVGMYDARFVAYDPEVSDE